MSTIGMFPSGDDDLEPMLREANELRRARGLQQLGPRWRVEGRDLYHPHRLAHAMHVFSHGLLHRGQPLAS